MLLNRYPHNHRAWFAVGGFLASAGLVCLGHSLFQGAEFATGFFQGLGLSLLAGSLFLSIRGLMIYRARQGR